MTTPFMPTVTLSPDALLRVEGGEVITWAECERRMLAGRGPDKAGKRRLKLYPSNPKGPPSDLRRIGFVDDHDLDASPVVPVGREEIEDIIEQRVFADDATEFTGGLQGISEAADAILAALRKARAALTGEDQ